MKFHQEDNHVDAMQVEATGVQKDINRHKLCPVPSAQCILLHMSGERTRNDRGMVLVMVQTIIAMY